MDPEADYKPFELVEEDGRTILRLHGTEERRAKVEANRVHPIMDAIAQGWDIDIEYADIEGDLDINEIADELGRAHDKLVIKGNIRMRRCNISGSADFESAQFRGSANFGSAQFIEDASFESAQFIEDASFESAQFIEAVNFGFAQFGGSANFRVALFSGYAYFESAQFIEDTNFEYAHFSGNANFEFAHFSGDADFGSAQFGGDADFGSALFSGDAGFFFAKFSENACFSSANFSRSAHFNSANFNRTAHFEDVVMARPADFAGVKFRQNYVIKGLWNATLGRIKRLHWQATYFSGFNTEKVMDGASNPWLKRYIDDELWIQSWRGRSWWRELWFTIWELTSHCGRSIGLWAFWSALIATVFAFVYRVFGPGSITFNVARLDSFQPDIWDYLYYSVVTFTTLGFGDIVPLTKPARLAVGAEVVLGYVMLGGLISIFANKLARRS